MKSIVMAILSIVVAYAMSYSLHAILLVINGVVTEYEMLWGMTVVIVSIQIYTLITGGKEYD